MQLRQNLYCQQRLIRAIRRFDFPFLPFGLRIKLTFLNFLVRAKERTLIQFPCNQKRSPFHNSIRRAYLLHLLSLTYLNYSHIHLYQPTIINRCQYQRQSWLRFIKVFRMKVSHSILNSIGFTLWSFPLRLMAAFSAGWGSSNCRLRAGRAEL